MNTYILKQKSFVFILVTILMIIFGTQSISFAQEANPTITASVEEPLTEATLHGSIITLTLTGGRFVDWNWRVDIRNALSVSGIDGVTFRSWDVERVSDTVATVELKFAGNIDINATLTFTVAAGAIAEYNGNALTATLPVTAIQESLEASTETPLTEANLHGSIITLILNGQFDDRWKIEDALSVSGINGVTVDGVRRVSDTVVTVELEFAGNIDTDATLTFTVEAGAIVAYDGNALTATLPVTAIQESLEASTEAPLTEAMLNGGIIALTLTGRKFVDRWNIRDAVSISGVDGISLAFLSRVSDTEVAIRLGFAGNIDEDTILTLTVGADAILGGYDNDFIIQIPVTAVEESLEASTEAPLTEATLHRSVITLTLSGRQFNDAEWVIEEALSVSGIDGVTIGEWWWSHVRRVNDTEATLELTFSGNIDEDATLTLTVGADAIVGYDKDFTFQFPVTAVEESLTASTEFPLTEATLDGSIISLSLSGRHFADLWYIEGDDILVSGIEGVDFESWDHVSDTEIAVPLVFDGTDFDTDATLTFTVAASLANYNQALTAEIPVTAIKQSGATVSISPSSVACPDVGETLTFSLNITGGENIAGYQATVLYSSTAFDYMRSVNGNYLPEDSFFWARGTKLAASTLSEASNGDGTLATLTFKVEDFKPSTLTISKVYLVDADGKRWEAATENGEVTIPPEPENAILGDINRDGVVNIQDLVIVSTRFGQRGNNSADINGDHLVDIVDLVLVASAVNAAAAAPPLNSQVLKLITASDVQFWLSQARQLTLTDLAYRRGITVLEQLLKTLTPKKTILLPNYPNPFNPETWIPYHLSNDVDVQISIYDTKGVLVRRLDLGHQVAAYYTDRTKAAYWDGKNAFGERVASGVYFYHLSAGDYSATRKMLILK